MQKSLYIPPAHRVEDRNVLHDFMAEFPFVELVTAAPGIRITHIPVALDRNAGRYGTLYGHVSSRNPQREAFDGRTGAVAVFRGPHSYISPGWYAAAEAVPTWNFAAVHASGTLRAVTGQSALRDLLARLGFTAEPSPYVDGMMAGIAGFTMEIERLEGKFKLGQERSEADRQGILRNLRAAPPERSLYQITEEHYLRISTPAPARGPVRPE
ncbi:MAG: FMN-binding negative transcriptional regulator [Acidobacteriota bacterium]